MHTSSRRGHKNLNFTDEKYISLKTRKRNGKKVSTPLWFILSQKIDEKKSIYAFTSSKSGKVKRIRNFPDAEVMLCDFRGNTKSCWEHCKVELISEKKIVKDVIVCMRYKYRWQMILLEVIATLGSRKKFWTIIKITVN